MKKQYRLLLRCYNLNSHWSCFWNLYRWFKIRNTICKQLFQFDRLRLWELSSKGKSVLIHVMYSILMLTNRRYVELISFFDLLFESRNWDSFKHSLHVNSSNWIAVMIEFIFFRFLLLNNSRFRGSTRETKRLPKRCKYVILIGSRACSSSTHTLLFLEQIQTNSMQSGFRSQLYSVCFWSVERALNGFQSNQLLVLGERWMDSNPIS